ncbi:hypothetical protein [Bradyrhizobium sp. S3.2.12]|uniref:hypothetical protein n=1 Tax=Bradyrhizobium sp. S3.2.12 TaxID=3156387 RepID=UPI003399C6D3
MAWSAVKRVILNIKVIRVNDDVTKEISGVALPLAIAFEWEKFVLSVTRTRGMQVQVKNRRYRFPHDQLLDLVRAARAAILVSTTRLFIYC